MDRSRLGACAVAASILFSTLGALFIPVASVSAVTCVRTRVVVAAITTTYANPTANGCWSWIRPSTHQPKSDPAECLRDDPQRTWAYNEISFDNTATHDKTNIKACYNTYTTQEAGYLYYARRLSDGAYPSGHVPTLPKYALRASILELYNGQGLANTDAANLWTGSYRAKGFSAMINIGGNASVASVKAWVLWLCRNSSNGTLGLYAGSGEVDRLTSELRTAVTAALNTCTTVR